MSNRNKAVDMRQHLIDKGVIDSPFILLDRMKKEAEESGKVMTAICIFVDSDGMVTADSNNESTFEVAGILEAAKIGLLCGF